MIQLSDLLRPDLIRVGLEAETREEAIRELVDVLVQAHELPYAQRDEVVESVVAHEREFASGLSRGVAIPHGPSDKVEDILCAFGISERGVHFDTHDGRPARFIMLMITPRRSFVGTVRTLACVVRLLGSEKTLNEMLEKCDGKGIYECICRMEQQS